MIQFNPFSTNAPFLYLLKTSENLRFFDVFRGFRSGALVGNGLIKPMSSYELRLLLEKVTELKCL